MCENCGKKYNSFHNFNTHLGNHFSLKCYCGKIKPSIASLRKCCYRNGCNNKNISSLELNPENDIEIVFKVPDNYLETFAHKIKVTASIDLLNDNNNEEDNNEEENNNGDEIIVNKNKITKFKDNKEITYLKRKSSRWKHNDETQVFRGYNIDEIKKHHPWVEQLEIVNEASAPQTMDSKRLKKINGRLRNNCAPRAGHTNSFICRYIKFLYYYKNLNINEVIPDDFFNMEYFEVFFKFYGDSHSSSTLSNQLDCYKIVIRFLIQNENLSKKFKHRLNPIFNRCKDLKHHFRGISKTSNFQFNSNGNITNSCSKKLASTHLIELNKGRMLSGNEMLSLFHFLLLNFKNISIIWNIIEKSEEGTISDDDLYENADFWKSLLMNMQLITFHLYGIALYGQRAQISQYSIIHNFVYMEGIFGYAPYNEKTERRDKIIPLPNWFIPIFALQKKLRLVLLKYNCIKYNPSIIVKNEINKEVTNYDSAFINENGLPFTRHDFSNVIHIFKYIFCDYSISFSRSYRRGLFTLYVSSNFDRFIKLLNINETEMMNLMSRTYNTSEEIINKYYVRSNSIVETHKLSTAIRSSLIGNENSDILNRYELDNDICDELGINIVEYSENPTKRNYIKFDAKNNIFKMYLDKKLIQNIDLKDTILIKFDKKNKIPIFIQPKINGLKKIPNRKTIVKYIGINPIKDYSKLSINFCNFSNNNNNIDNLSLNIIEFYNENILNNGNNSNLNNKPMQILTHKSEKENDEKYISFDCYFLIYWDDGTESWENNYNFDSFVFQSLYDKYILKLMKNKKLKYFKDEEEEEQEENQEDQDEQQEEYQEEEEVVEEEDQEEYEEYEEYEE